MIVERFLAWLETASEAHRCEAAFALAKLWLEPEMDECDRDAAEASMTLLLDDACTDVRRALAEAFAEIETAPRHLILALVGDEPDISETILLRSPVFVDGELVEFVKAGVPGQQAAIARRESVPPIVCEALATDGDEAACLLMLENAGARIEPAALHVLAARHGANTSIRHMLLQFDGLLPKTRLLLIDKLGDELRQEMAETPGLSPARISQMIADHAERAIIAYAAHADEHELPQIALALIETERMTTAFLLRAICMGNIALFANAIAGLCHVPPRRVDAAMEAGRRSAFRALYVKAGLPDVAFDVFACAVEAWRKVLAGAEAADGARLTWLVTREVLSSYRGTPGVTVDGLLVLLRRLAAEAARVNARSHAGRISLEQRDREQKLLEMHAENHLAKVLEQHPVIDLPDPVLLNFAMHLADEIVEMEENAAAQAEADAALPAEAGAPANDDINPEADDATDPKWGVHPLHVDLGDAVAPRRAA